MRSKYRSSKALVVSFTLHAIVGVIGFFFWTSNQFVAHQDSINAVLMKVEEPKRKRMNRPKRPQVQRQKTTVQTNQPALKILTSNAPATDRGVVSAAEPTQFSLGPMNLDDNVGLSTGSITPQAMPQMERVITNPIKKVDSEERPKSRLVRFIERQEGPQRIIYCIDLSSSMIGLQPRKLRRILGIMANSLEFLEPHDQFNVCTFSEEVQFYQPNFLPVSDTDIADTIAHLESAKPVKSERYSDKDMLEALQETHNRGPTIVVLFSDGILTSGIPDLKAIKQQATTDIRIFTMAIDMAEDFPGAVLLGMLATRSEGEFWLVGR
jgi:hypothetical protein